MAEATLRGYVEVEAHSAKALSKAGWPVEVRYFIPKAGTKAVSVPKTNGSQKPATERRPHSRNNFLGIGPDSGEHLYGDRQRVAICAHEAIEKQSPKMVRRTKLRDYVSNKLKLTRQQASSQVSHLVRLNVLQDLGQFPPEWQKANQKASKAGAS